MRATGAPLLRTTLQLALQRVEGGFDHPVNILVLAHEISGNAQPRALERIGAK